MFEGNGDERKARKKEKYIDEKFYERNGMSVMEVERLRWIGHTTEMGVIDKLRKVKKQMNQIREASYKKKYERVVAPWLQE